MSFIVKHLDNIADLGVWYNISDYVAGVSPVPYIFSNRDGTLRVESYNLEIAETVNLVRGDGYVFPNDTEIAVYDGTTFVAHGYIKESNFDVDTRIHSLRVESAIGRLRELSFQYNSSVTGQTLHQLFASGTAWYEYVETDDSTLRQIMGITWGLQKMFEVFGFTLNKDIETETMFEDNTGFRDVLPNTVRYYEIVAYEDMLFCAGLDYATGGENGYGKTVFDIVSELCSYMGLTVIQTSVGEFKLIEFDDTKYIVTDDNKGSYQGIYKGAEKIAFSTEWKYNSVIANYFGTTQTDLNSGVVTGGGEKIDDLMLNNILLMWTDNPVGEYSGGGIPTPTYSTKNMIPDAEYVANAHPPNAWNPILRKSLYYAFDYFEEKITTPFTLTEKPVTENFIDLEKQNFSNSPRDLLMSIFSTNKPSVFEATATFTGISSSGSGSAITFTLGSSHGLVAGDAIHTSGFSVSGHNGIFEIASVTSTEVIVTSSVSGSGTGGSVRKGYWFKNCTFEYDFVQPDQLNFRSVITGKKTNTHLGDYGTFRVNERLWQGSTTARPTTNKFAQLYALYHTDVWFFPHSNKTILDSSSNVVTCYFKAFKPLYYRNLINYDAVACEFEVNEYYDVSKLI